MYTINRRKVIILFVLLLSPLSHYATKLENNFCGFEQTCSKNTSKFILSVHACCRPCECDDICREKGTCCRDKQELIDHQLISAKQKCLTSAHVPIGVPVPPDVLSYYNRINCPKTFTDTNIRANCEGDRPKTIIDILPVSSLDGNILYKNKYCSYCHGERKISSWKVVVHRASPVSCTRMLRDKFIDIDTITPNLLSNCILAFTPPENIAFWKVLCFKDSSVTKQCNMTGKWAIFDNELNNLCLNETGTGYYIFQSPTTVYRNVYCSICNDLSYNQVETCVNRIGRFPNRSLFVLVNIHKVLDHESIGNTRQCGNREIFDTFFDMCRTLYCFWSSISFQGKCVPFLEYPRRMGYNFVVELVPTEIINQTDLTRANLKNYYLSIQEKLDFGNCRICSLYMFAEIGDLGDILKKIYIQYVFTSTTRCKTENIWSKFRNVEDKLPLLLNLRVYKKNVTFNASWGDSTPLSSYNLKKVLLMGEPEACQAITPTPGFFCPKLKLLKHEVETVMKGHPRAEELVWFKNHENINGSAFVCSYKYISYEHSLSSQKCNPFYSEVLIIIHLRVWNVLAYKYWL